MGVQIHVSKSTGGHKGPDTRQQIHRGSWGSRYTPADPEGVTGVQIHTSRSSGGHGGSDTHQQIQRGSGGPDTHQQIQRGLGGSRYTPADPQGVMGIQIHTSRSTGGHGGPDTHQQIQRGSWGSR